MEKNTRMGFTEMYPINNNSDIVLKKNNNHNNVDIKNYFPLHPF